MSAAELTDEEREHLRTFLLVPKRENHKAMFAAVECIIAAHVRRALEDAADEDSVKLTSLYGTETLFVETRRLRARAAAVAPRETKD